MAEECSLCQQRRMRLAEIISLCKGVGNDYLNMPECPDANCRNHARAADRIASTHRVAAHFCTAEADT